MRKYSFCNSGCNTSDTGFVLRSSTVAEYRIIQKAPVPKLSQFQKLVSMKSFSTIVFMITVNAIELVHQCCCVIPEGSTASFKPFNIIRRKVIHLHR